MKRALGSPWSLVLMFFKCPIKYLSEYLQKNQVRWEVSYLILTKKGNRSCESLLSYRLEGGVPLTTGRPNNNFRSGKKKNRFSNKYSAFRKWNQRRKVGLGYEIGNRVRGIRSLNANGIRKGLISKLNQSKAIRIPV